MEWYRQRVYKLEEEDKSWDPVITPGNENTAEEKFQKAYTKGMEWGDRIPTGVFYDNRAVPSFTKRLNEFVPNYLDYPPSQQIVTGKDGYTPVDPYGTFAEKLI